MISPSEATDEAMDSWSGSEDGSEAGPGIGAGPRGEESGIGISPSCAALTAFALSATTGSVGLGAFASSIFATGSIFFVLVDVFSNFLRKPSAITSGSRRGGRGERSSGIGI